MVCDRRAPVTSGMIVVLELTLLFTVSILARSAFLDREPIHDELYHLLAARSWADNGSLSIADGEYSRGRLYTVFVGSVYKLFGDDVTTVRWSSAIVGSLWVLGVFAWCRRRFDRTVAWTAALLFSLAPGAVFLSQYIRFYVLHGLLFWLIAVAVFELVECDSDRWKKALITACVLLFFLAATHLQLTTVVGVGGIGLYLAVRGYPVLIQRSAKNPGFHRWLIGVFIACAVVIAFLIHSGIAAEIVAIYRWAPAWASNSGFLRYHWMLVEQYPLIWGMVPVAVILAVYSRSRPAIYSASIFCTAIVLHSFAGMKAERFIFYVMPFFFVLGAVLFKEGLLHVNKMTAEITKIVPAGMPGVQGFVRIGLMSIVCLFLFLSNPAFRATADMVRGQPVSDSTGGGRYWDRYQTVWSHAAPELQALARKSEVVLSASELHMLYFVGRVDIELNFSRLSELVDGAWHQGQEFTSDFRTGRPVISSAESVEQVVSCFRTGLVVVRADNWTKPIFIPVKTRETIESMMEEVDLSDEWGLRVWAWKHRDFKVSPECARLEESITTGAVDTSRRYSNG